MTRVNRSTPVTSYTRSGSIKNTDMPAHNAAPTQNKSYHTSPSLNLNVPEVRELAPEQVLFLQGEPADTAYFIETGEIDIMVQGLGPDKKIATLKAGEIVGEMGVIDGDFRSATAIAKTKTRVRVIDRKVITDMLNSATPGVKALLNSMMQRLRDANTKLSGGGR